MKILISSLLIAIGVLVLIAMCTGHAFAGSNARGYDADDIQSPYSSVRNQRSEYPAMTVTVHNGNILLASPPQVLFSVPILGYGTLKEMDDKAGLPCHDAIRRPLPPLELIRSIEEDRPN
jgi:hypothetical protein